MKKLKLKGLELNDREMLERNQLKAVFGGYTYGGDWACGCNSGVNITGAPDCSASTCNWACNNQGGWNGSCVCAGSNC